MKTVLRYAGGKSKAYAAITPYIKHLQPTRIISPFFGGGSLESRWSSELKIPVAGYDIFPALVNFWQTLLSTPIALTEQLTKLKPTPEQYAEIKETLLRWDVTQEMLQGKTSQYYVRDAISLDAVTAAAYYYFNHNLSYGPMFLGWMSKIYQSEPRWQAMINRIRMYHNPQLSVSFGDFEKVIPNHPEDFLYIDPPYFLEKDTDNKMFKGIYPNANIPIHHNGFPHDRLRDLLYAHRGNFVLSYNNCETIRDYYKDFTLVYPTWHYSYALGETRIGKNKAAAKTTNKQSHEILIIKGCSALTIPESSRKNKTSKNTSLVEHVAPPLV